MLSNPYAIMTIVVMFPPETNRFSLMRPPKNVFLVSTDETLAAILEKGLRKGGYRVSAMLRTTPPKPKRAIREKSDCKTGIKARLRSPRRWNALACLSKSVNAEQIRPHVTPSADFSPDGYLLGSYRIATAPEPNSSRLTSFKSTASIAPRTTSAHGR